MVRVLARDCDAAILSGGLDAFELMPNIGWREFDVNVHFRVDHDRSSIRLSSHDCICTRHMSSVQNLDMGLSSKCIQSSGYPSAKVTLT